MTEVKKMNEIEKHLKKYQKNADAIISEWKTEDMGLTSPLLTLPCK